MSEILSTVDSNLLETENITNTRIGCEIDINSSTDDLYNDLLDELLETLDKNQNFILPDKDEVISKPKISFADAKTRWENVRDILKQINRDEAHLLKFFSTEYRKTTSINKNGFLLISGRYANMIPNTLKKYVKIYVQCGACRSIKTSIIKNFRMGLDYKKCSKCGKESPIIEK